MDKNDTSYAAQASKQVLDRLVGLQNAPTMPSPPSVDESLAVAHEACARAEGTLDAIWADLTGYEPDCYQERSCAGVPIQPSAASLVDRVQRIAETAENIRRRISPGNPVQGERQPYNPTRYADPLS